MKNSEKTLDMIVNLCKNRGYVYAGSEIYGGLANSWDYGPLGVEFKNNVKKAWLKKFVQESDYLGYHRPRGFFLRSVGRLQGLRFPSACRPADLRLRKW